MARCLGINPSTEGDAASAPGYPSRVEPVEHKEFTMATAQASTPPLKSGRSRATHSPARELSQAARWWYSHLVGSPRSPNSRVAYETNHAGSFGHLCCVDF